MDPIYALATPFRTNELKSASKKILVQPLTYDRTVIESSWRLCSRNRMRTNRRTSLVSFDRTIRAAADHHAPAAKKSRTDDSVAESGIVGKNSADSAVYSTDINVNKLPVELASESCELAKVEQSSCTDDSSADDVSGSFCATVSSYLSGGHTECHDTGVQVTAADTDVATSDCSPVNDSWWNQVDSRTWLQGLQSYLQLHSSVGFDHRQMQVAILPANAAPGTVMASAISCRQTSPPVVMPSAVAQASTLPAQRQIVRPVLATPVTGYKMSTNGAVTLVPIVFFPVINYGVCGSTATSVPCQQTALSRQQSSLAAVDLVSFMHNYCLPPTSVAQSAADSALPSTTHSDTHQLPDNSNKVSYAQDSQCDQLPVTSVLQQTEEDCHPSSRSTTLGSPGCGKAARFLPDSSVCLTLMSQSSNSSAESLANDASEVTSSFVALDSGESISLKTVDVKTSDFFSMDADLSIPGWFGKGLGIKRCRRRPSRQS